MKITKRVLHIPPYLSTAWRNVAALHLEDRPGMTRPLLVVQLVDGTAVEVPDLNQMMLDKIFESHEQHMDEEEKEEQAHQQQPHPIGMNPFGGGEQMMGLPFKIGPAGMEGMGGALQHDPAQSEAPELPPELLSKVAGIAQVLGADADAHLPQAEPGCNCFHCQIARAITNGTGAAVEEQEEEVSEEDLKFRDWDIRDDGDSLFTVINPLDQTEQYQVYLGTPVGCTCGKQDCEHIKVVLKS